MSILRFLKAQLKHSMLTGIPQIIQARGTLQKLLKFLVLICCFIGCMYQIWLYMQVYWKYPVIVDVFVSNPSHISLPAFTVCEYNGIQKSKFCKSFKELCTPNKSLWEFCMGNSGYCGESVPPESTKEKVPAIAPEELPINISDLRAEYRKLGSTYLHFVSYVQHGNVTFKPRQISVFNLQNLPTNCYAFNTVWGNGSATLTKEPQRKSIEIALKTTMNENFYLSTPNAIQMAVHSPFMMVNPFTDGFSIRPCTTYKMQLQKIEKTLLPAPYSTNCTDYVTMWRDRGGYGPLNQEMCVRECAFNQSIKLFGCFDPGVINYPNDDALFCFNGEASNIDKVFKNCGLNCQPACYITCTHQVKSAFIYDQTWYQTLINYIIQQLSEVWCAYDYRCTRSFEIDELITTRCRTGIEISFVRNQVMKFSYKKKYEIVEAFGYIGGFLGMWLGISLIAVCDFLETCLIILIHACKRRKSSYKKNKNHVFMMKMQEKRMFLM
ncbi:uncharacterized protein TNIN_410311 [Trichonephila inaurata madagascariensis]|uniref:Uncharacterized protein n=1 Tax=Trichonephila inaurata madagascariensis TaxID=2747483 RepID=A0A8X6XCT9_9ARAC|nr:uncharacterized protein TNIN_410311 [Trichonephila inaurata madagascariensis]